MKKTLPVTMTLDHKVIDTVTVQPFVKAYDFERKQECTIWENVSEEGDWYTIEDGYLWPVDYLDGNDRFMIR